MRPIRTFLCVLLVAGATACGAAGGDSMAGVVFPSFQQEEWSVIIPAGKPGEQIVAIYRHAESHSEIAVLRPEAKTERLDQAGAYVVDRLVSKGYVPQDVGPQMINDKPVTYATRLLGPDGTDVAAVMTVRRLADGNTVVMLGSWPVEGDAHAFSVMRAFAVDLAYQSLPAGD